MAFTMENIKHFLPLLEAQINKYLNTYGWCVNNKLKLVRLYVEPYTKTRSLDAEFSIVSEVDVSNMDYYDQLRYSGRTKDGIYTEKVHVYSDGHIWTTNTDVNYHITIPYMFPFTYDMKIQEYIYAFENCRKATNTFKKELIESVWHPERVTKWVEAGISLEDL